MWPEGPINQGSNIVIRVFIGYDPREALAFSVLAYSIHARASRPVSIAPIMLSQLQGVMTRERHPLQDRKSTRLNSSHIPLSRMPSSA